eukprot:g1907.t1
MITLILFFFFSACRAFHINQKVIAKTDPNENSWREYTIQSISGDTLTLKSNRGETIEGTADDLRLIPYHTQVQYEEGQNVFAKWNTGLKYWPGKITKVISPRKLQRLTRYEIFYDDDGSSKQVTANNICIDARKEEGKEQGDIEIIDDFEIRAFETEDESSKRSFDNTFTATNDSNQKDNSNSHDEEKESRRKRHKIYESVELATEPQNQKSSLRKDPTKSDDGFAFNQPMPSIEGSRSSSETHFPPITPSNENLVSSLKEPKVSPTEFRSRLRRGPRRNYAEADENDEEKIFEQYGDDEDSQPLSSTPQTEFPPKGKTPESKTLPKEKTVNRMKALLSAVLDQKTHASSMTTSNPAANTKTLTVERDNAGDTLLSLAVKTSPKIQHEAATAVGDDQSKKYSLSDLANAADQFDSTADESSAATSDGSVYLSQTKYNEVMQDAASFSQLFRLSIADQNYIAGLSMNGLTSEELFNHDTMYKKVFTSAYMVSLYRHFMRTPLSQNYKRALESEDCHSDSPPNAEAFQQRPISPMTIAEPSLDSPMLSPGRISLTQGFGHSSASSSVPSGPIIVADRPTRGTQTTLMVRSFNPDVGSRSEQLTGVANSASQSILKLAPLINLDKVKYHIGKLSESEKRMKPSTSRWSTYQHLLYMQGVAEKNDFQTIGLICGRSNSQVRTHHQKFCEHVQNLVSGKGKKYGKLQEFDDVIDPKYFSRPSNPDVGSRSGQLTKLTQPSTADLLPKNGEILPPFADSSNQQLQPSPALNQWQRQQMQQFQEWQSQQMQQHMQQFQEWQWQQMLHMPQFQEWQRQQMQKNSDNFQK